MNGTAARPLTLSPRLKDTTAQVRSLRKTSTLAEILLCELPFRGGQLSCLPGAEPAHGDVIRACRPERQQSLLSRPCGA